LVDLPLDLRLALVVIQPGKLYWLFCGQSGQLVERVVMVLQRPDLVRLQWTSSPFCL